MIVAPLAPAPPPRKLCAPHWARGERRRRRRAAAAPPLPLAANKPTYRLKKDSYVCSASIEAELVWLLAAHLEAADGDALSAERLLCGLVARLLARSIWRFGDLIRVWYGRRPSQLQRNAF